MPFIYCQLYDLTTTMPSLTRKLVKGRPYFYVRHCQRIDGRPKIVKTTYLGSLQHILQAVEKAQTPPPPQQAEVLAFGEIAALYDQAIRLGLVELIDSHLPKRDQGLSVGQYLLLAALNRAAAPTSKAQLARWHRQSILTRLLPATADQLSSQAFWNHMDRIGQADIVAIERQLSQRLVRDWKLNLRTLVYDGTNFFTYINTLNPATLPARGHNKQKRGDLRQVNLGLLVSTDFHVPLFHKVYTGNVNDSTAFQTISQELSQRYRQLAQGCEHITLIFDKGNNSAQSFEVLDSSPFHFIGSLVPTHHEDLLAIPLDQFQPLAGDRWAGCLAYRARKVVFSQERTVVVTYNEHLLEGQLQGINASLQKARRKLDELQVSLRRRQQGKVKGGQAPTVLTVSRRVEQILSGQFLKSLLRCRVQPGPVPVLTYRTDTTAFSRLVRTHLGKTILFTDNDSWTNEEIVAGYRSQNQIESAFRDMKNPHFLGWAPMFHWTDSKIRVHAFYCVLALTLTSLLQRTLHQQGLDLSMDRALQLLSGIREVLLVYPRQPGQHQPRTATCLSELDAEQQPLFAKLNLSRYQRV
jgi:transposase